MEDFESPNSEIEINNDFMTPEMFQDLSELPEILPKYEGTGSTSYKKAHDQDKLSYISKLGIDLSDCTDEDGEITDRAILNTTFNVLSYILIIEQIRRDGNDISKVTHDFCKKLEEKRIETGTEREITNQGKSYSDYFREFGLNNNPTLKVTRRELYKIVNNIFISLKGERTE